MTANEADRIRERHRDLISHLEMRPANRGALVRVILLDGQILEERIFINPYDAQAWAASWAPARIE